MTVNSEKVIAFLLYPGLSLLDLVGPYSVLSNLGRGYRTVVVGENVESMPDDFGLGITPHLSIDDVPEPHVLIVPGADLATFSTMANDKLMNYIRSAGAKAEVLASVCTGACILAAAGFLEGRQATTHWAYAPIWKNWVPSMCGSDGLRMEKSSQQQASQQESIWPYI